MLPVGLGDWEIYLALLDLRTSHQGLMMFGCGYNRVSCFGLHHAGPESSVEFV